MSPSKASSPNRGGKARQRLDSLSVLIHTCSPPAYITASNSAEPQGLASYNRSSVVSKAFGMPVSEKVTELKRTICAKPLAARNITGMPWPLKPAIMN